jgi:tetraacyldisaccharide-1-P 4'-kinase
VRWDASTVSTGARARDMRLSWKDLASMRVGLLCALARPERIVRSLERRGVSPRVVVRGGDHGPLDEAVFARAARARVELGIEMWLATSKCALHFARGVADVGNRLQAPLAEIEHALELSSGLKSRLRALGLP